MVKQFETVMAKLAVVAQDPSTLIDCSEVIPVPAKVNLPPPTLPAGQSLNDVQAAVRPPSPSLIQYPPCPGSPSLPLSVLRCLPLHPETPDPALLPSHAVVLRADDRPPAPVSEQCAATSFPALSAAPGEYQSQRLRLRGPHAVGAPGGCETYADRPTLGPVCRPRDFGCSCVSFLRSSVALCVLTDALQPALVREFTTRATSHLELPLGWG